MEVSYSVNEDQLEYLPLEEVAVDNRDYIDYIEKMKKRKLFPENTFALLDG